MCINLLGVISVSDYVYDLMRKHHSVRKFKDSPLSDDTVKKLVEAGQGASTSSYLQTYSIIGVDDPEIKENLKEVSGQPYVLDNGYLFVFVLDYYRHSLVNEKVDSDMEVSYGSAEGLLVGTIDVALVSENMAVGEPAEDEGGEPKPRLPFEHIFHKNSYDASNDKQRRELDEYDQVVSDYYKERTNGERTETWTEQIESFLGRKTRLDMLDQLNKAGFIKR